MNEMKHTPGPWEVVEGNKAPKRLAAWICTVGNNPGDPAIFSTVFDGDKFVFGDKLADARLMAAAPTMRDLLERASEASSPIDDVRTAWWDARNAALSRATAS